MKLLFLFLSALISIGFLGMPTSTKAAAGEYPEGTISFVGNSARSINVKAGDKIDVQVKMTKSKKLCKVYVLYYKTDGRNPKTTNNLNNALSLTVTRGQSDNYDLKGSLNTAGLPNGTYRAFIYGDQSCDYANPWGNEDNEFACDGNPTCSAYCGQKQRAESPDGAPEEPGDLYRTSSNPAYYAPYGSAQCSPGNTAKVAGAPQNSCGEVSGGPSCDEPSFATRVGECEIKACDTTGQGRDNLTFVVGAVSGGGGGSASPSPGAPQSPRPSPSVSPSPGFSVSPSPAVQDETYPKLRDGEVGVPTGKSNLQLTNNSVVNVSGGLTNLSPKVLNVGGVNKPLEPPINFGGEGGSVPLNAEKTVKITGSASGGVNLTNKDDQDLSLNIPSDSTVVSSSRWDGKIKVPTEVKGTGSAPKGFKVGEKVVSVGSDNEILLFDKPVTILLKGVIKGLEGAIGYKPAGSGNWVDIAECRGTFDSPTAPDFPKECYKSSTSDTKILSYHLTQFGPMIVKVPELVSVEPGICYSEDRPTVRLAWKTDSDFKIYGVGKTVCDSYQSCTQPELPAVQGFIPIRDLKVESIDDLLVEKGRYYKYRVWGGLSEGGPTDMAFWDPRYWSRSVVIRVNDCLGKGLKLQELIIPR